MIWLILIIIALGTAILLVSPLTKTVKQPVLISALIIGIMASTLGLYALLGTPAPPEIQPTAQQEGPDINAMVKGLADRLAAEPDDPQGWARLIRSRIVLGDMAALIRDHKTMSAHYAAQPDVIAQINQQSGFDALAAKLSE